MKLKTFYKQLEQHDWFYDFSDDFRVVRSGAEDRRRLKSISKESREHAKLFLAFKDYHFSGESFGTKKKKKPVKPV